MLENNILLYSKIAAFISLFLFFISMSVLVWSGLKLPNQISSLMSQTQTDLVQTHILLNNLNDTITRTNLTLDSVNRQCGVSEKPCGTLADINKTLGTIRGTFGQIEIAANHEDKNLYTLDSQETQIFKDSHQLIINGNTSLFALTSTLNTFNNAEKNLPALFNVTTGTITDLDGAVKRINNKLDDSRFESITTHLDNISAHVDGMTADTQYKMHQLFHPDKVKLTFWSGTDATLMYIHSHILPPLF